MSLMLFHANVLLCNRPEMMFPWRVAFLDRFSKSWWYISGFQTFHLMISGIGNVLRGALATIFIISVFRFKFYKKPGRSVIGGSQASEELLWALKAEILSEFSHKLGWDEKSAYDFIMAGLTSLLHVEEIQGKRF